MDFIPAVVEVEHKHAGDADVTADWRQHQRVVITLTRGHRVGLGDRVLADRLKNQITGLLARVATVETGLASAGLAGVEAEPNVVVTIGLRRL